MSGVGRVGSVWGRPEGRVSTCTPILDTLGPSLTAGGAWGGSWKKLIFGEGDCSLLGAKGFNGHDTRNTRTQSSNTNYNVQNGGAQAPGHQGEGGQGSGVRVELHSTTQ